MYLSTVPSNVSAPPSSEKHEIQHQEISNAATKTEKSAKHDASLTSATGDDVIGFEADLSDLPPGYFRSKFFVGSMVAIGLSLLATTATFGYAAPILTIINEDIGPDPRYTWIALSYNVCIAVCLTPLGRLTDTFGRRYWFIGAGVIATIGSVVCATAQSIPVLIGGNVLLGMSGAAQLSFPYTMGEIVPSKYRYLATGFVYLFCFPGSGFGPSIAYSFIEKWPSVGWRGIYWLLLSINGVALLCWVLFYFPPSFTKKHLNDGGRASKMYWIKNYDYVGTALFAAGLVVFMLGLSWGGSIYPWNSAATIAPIVLGFLTLVAFGLWEAFAPIKEPLVPKHLFKERAWVVSVLLMGIGASVYYAFAIVWPMQVSVLYSTGDLTWIGIVSSSLSLVLVTGQVFGSLMAHRLGKIRIQGMCLMTIAATFMAATASTTPYNFPQTLAFVLLGSFFVGWNESIFIANSAICIRDQRDIGIAGGLAGSVRSAISALASAAYTTALTNRLAVTIPEQVPPAVVDAGLPSSSVESFIAALSAGTAAAMQAVPGITDQIAAVGTVAYKEAYADAFKTVYLCTLAFTGFGIVISWWSPDTTKYMSTRVAATLHRENVKPDSEKATEMTSEDHSS